MLCYYQFMAKMPVLVTAKVGINSDFIQSYYQKMTKLPYFDNRAAL